MNRAQALANLRSRRNPEGLIKEAYSQLREDDSVQYLAGAMEPVEGSYTKKTLEEGERVRNQIEKGLEREHLSAEYEYQGSVTKNTHIRAYSDIDLLVIEKRFYSLEAPQTPVIIYTGNPLEDLIQLRNICIGTLRGAYPQANVDISGPRSVKISGGSLARTVDVVPANWWNTNTYAQHQIKAVRGVHVLNAHIPEREPDTPFLHGELIGIKDQQTIGNTRKLVRLLKSLKYESDGKVIMSSYDIEALVYKMDNQQMQKQQGEEIPLATNCWLWLKKVEEDQILRDGLDVPDGKRKIFAQGKATLAQLTALRNELGQLLWEIEQGLKKSFRKLAEARLQW